MVGDQLFGSECVVGQNKSHCPRLNPDGIEGAIKARQRAVQNDPMREEMERHRK